MDFILHKTKRLLWYQKKRKQLSCVRDTASAEERERRGANKNSSSRVSPKVKLFLIAARSYEQAMSQATGRTRQVNNSLLVFIDSPNRLKCLVQHKLSLLQMRG
ncbi:hypothetical protein OPV22_006650 [Ensete ventricosum]|uniref:Uncharacterized protein n=1 Tax=Ensete ventricosum TaxID=4639 RepID=A0AAV8RNJ2_ENSVE|nr:hypothetical protein OPV22_006650 [Ensete ventricosum]